MSTVPSPGCVTASMDIGPPSAFRSFFSTSTAVAAASSFTVAESSTAVGASSTQVTVMDTVADEPPLSV